MSTRKCLVLRPDSRSLRRLVSQKESTRRRVVNRDLMYGRTLLPERGKKKVNIRGTSS